MTITKEGALASFYTVNKAPIKHLKVYFSPKQAGSGDQSPSNVRPISGCTGLEVTRCGKNIFNFDPNKMEVIKNGDGNSRWGYFMGKRFNTVTLSATTNNVDHGTNFAINACLHLSKDGNGSALDTFIGPSGTIKNRVFQKYESIPYVTLLSSYSSTGSTAKTASINKILAYNIQLELGSTATTYEPYSGITIPIDWSSEAGTLYGGYVDLITGELIVNQIKESLEGKQWTVRHTGENYQTLSTTLTNSYGYTTISPFIAEEFKVNYPIGGIQSLEDPDTLTPGVYWYYNTYNIHPTTIYVICANNYTPHGSVVYQIETPIIYQLTPLQLQTLIGRNNIWSDADRVEVEYESAESNDELYRRRNILLRSAPHIETVSGNIVNFQTDVVAPMKSAKINFSPIQEGGGTPSPTNVRPISGWTNLSLYHSGENLYVPNSNNKGYISKSGVITVDETSTYTDLIPVNLGDVYSFECTTVSVNGDTNRRIHGYNSSGTWVKQLTSGTTAANTVEYRKISATIPADISYIRVSFRNQDINVRIAKENIVTADWQTAAGTIYGGYLDLINGKLVETTQKKTYDGSSDEPWWIYSYGNYLGFGLIQNDMATSSRYHGLSNWLNASSMTDTHKYECWLGVNNKIIYIVGISDLLESVTVENWCAYLSEHPLEILIPLANPIEHTLSPQTLKTLKGTNNIWSNANGPVEIKYWTH